MRDTNTRSSTWEESARIAASALLLAALLTSAAPPVLAGEEMPGETPRVSLHGFGTLAIARTNDGNAQFVRDLSQPDGATSAWTGKIDSLLGIQANFHLGGDTDGVLQAVTRHHHDGTHGPELTWAFLRHDFSPDFSLRAGRLGTEFYMLGDSRLVGYSNLTVRPSPDFYGSLVFTYIDGLDASVTLPLADGLLRGKFFAGHSPEKVPFAEGITWDLDGSPLIGAYLDYLNGAWQVRLSHAQVRFERETPSDDLLRVLGDPLAGIPYLTFVPEMAMADTWARFSSLGLVYDKGPLQVQVMLNRVEQDSPAYEDSKAGYVLVAYRLGDFTPYLGFSRSFTSGDALPSSPVPGVDAITASLVTQSHVDQHTITFGGRWDLRKNLALKAQVDRIDGKPTSLFLFKRQHPDWDGDMTVYSLALDFVF